MRPYTVPLAASGWIAFAATPLPPSSALRAVVTVLFIAVCPGAAVMRITRTPEPESTDRSDLAFETVAVTSASLALTAIAGESLLLAGVFTQPHCVMALAAVTTLLAAVAGRGTNAGRRDPRACRTPRSRNASSPPRTEADRPRPARRSRAAPDAGRNHATRLLRGGGEGAH